MPVLIDKVHLPLGFGETQALSLCGWRGDQSAPQYQAILNAVRGIVGEAPSRPAIAASATPKVSRRTVVGGSAAAAAAAAAAGWYFFRGAPAEASNSIAVMPFANLSGDPSQAYFSDGLAEELRSALARIPELNVMARTSSEKVREDDIKTAAHKLGVANILIGSVRRSPSTIRVSTQLVDGHDGLERWSEAYDRPIGDTLNIQTDIAEKVAAALSVRLSSDPRTVLEAGGTTNPAAQDLLLQVDRDLAFNKEGLERRIAILDGALALDPNYAQAYARKASLLMVNAGTFASSANESYRGHIDALEVANKAIGIAPKMAAGYAVRGNIYRQLLNMRAAWADAARANTLPGKDDVEVLELESVLESQIGRSGEAERIVSKWIALDPLNPQAHAYQGVIRYNARRYPAAVESLQHSLAIAPNSDRARAFLGYALMAQGKTADAGIEFRKLKPDDYRRLLGQAVLAARAGRRLEALQNLQSMQHTLGDAGLFQYASIYAQLGMADEAFRDLQRAVSVRDSGASGIRTDPFLDPLRRDPRFAELERKIDFP